MAATLRLVPYDLSWPDRYAEAAARLREALGDVISAIEHVGSTAVPGLSGKPVLDIAIAVLNDAAADACIAPMTQLGYTYRGPNGEDPQRRYYTHDVAGVRVGQIHLYILPAQAWDEKLLFRDALRADPTLAAAYAAEKARLAVAVDWDKSAYALAKDPFVEQVLSVLRARSRSAISSHTSD